MFHEQIVQCLRFGSKELIFSDKFGIDEGILCFPTLRSTTLNSIFVASIDIYVDNTIMLICISLSRFLFDKRPGNEWKKYSFEIFSKNPVFSQEKRFL